jgi:hypothetical protein
VFIRFLWFLWLWFLFWLDEEPFTPLSKSYSRGQCQDAPVGGSLTIIPLTPVLIGAGIVAGTIVAVNLNRSPAKLKMAQLQTQTGDDKFYIQSFAGAFYSVEPGEDYRLTAKSQIQELEFFQMLKTDDGRFAFRAAKNQHVAVLQSKGVFWLPIKVKSASRICLPWKSTRTHLSRSSRATGNIYRLEGRIESH